MVHLTSQLSRSSSPGCSELHSGQQGIGAVARGTAPAFQWGALPPTIVLSEAGDIPSCVRAIRGGAHDFLTLPLMAPHLIESIRTAFEKDEQVIAIRRENDSLRRRWKSLTSREAEVMRYVVDGFLNKQTASELSITENTVQVHRGRVMRKMGADSFAALVRMSLKLAEWGESSMLCGTRSSIWGHGATIHKSSIV